MRKIIRLFLFVFVLVAGFVAVNSKFDIGGLLAPSVEDITYRFHSYQREIAGKQSLHVAQLKQVEVYQRTSQAKFWSLPLPDVVVSASFPVEYNFNVSLAVPWEFEKVGQVLVVKVPEISSQTPAVNISELIFEVKKGSILRNEDQAKELLQKDLRLFLIENSIVLKNDVREVARKAIKDFLQNWIVKSSGDKSSYEIEVRFPEELSMEQTK